MQRQGPPIRACWLLLFFCSLLGALASQPVLGQEAPVYEPQPFLEEAFEEFEEEEEDEIETDRDSFTPATTTAGRCRVIVEAAHSFIDNRNVPETHSYPELLVRIGANDWFEFRLGWNYEVGGAGNPVSGNVPSDLATEPELEREARILYGAKAVVTRQAGWTPESALIVQGYTPTEGEANDSQVSASYVFGWILPNDWTWDTAIHYGTSALEEDRFEIWAPSSVIKIPLGERWKAHAEYFGVFSNGRDDETTQHFFSPGAHYLVTPNLEFGVRVGWGLNEEAPNFFSNAGFGYRY